MVVGESAERRGAADPTRLAREFKRRLGDPAPILVAGTPFSAEALMAAVLRSVVADVTARQGEPPAHVTLTRPANWGPYKQELFSHVPVLADLGPSSTATEPEAAAVHFASTTRVAAGQSIAVYDLGGGTFDAAVLRKTDDGFTTLGTPEGIEHLGGADFDDAVFEYVRRVLGPAFAQLDPTDPAVRTAAARLRAECVLAKESLSRDTEATIPVALPGLQTEVRLTRQDFEDLVRPALMSTVESLRRTVRSARVPVDEIAATVLAGGSSRIPLVAELITGELQLPVAVGTHPKHTVALGAALLAARDAGRVRVDEPTGRFNPGDDRPGTAVRTGADRRSAVGSGATRCDLGDGPEGCGVVHRPGRSRWRERERGRRPPAAGCSGCPTRPGCCTRSPGGGVGRCMLVGAIVAVAASWSPGCWSPAVEGRAAAGAARRSGRSSTRPTGSIGSPDRPASAVLSDPRPPRRRHPSTSSSSPASSSSSSGPFTPITGIPTGVTLPAGHHRCPWHVQQPTANCPVTSAGHERGSAGHPDPGRGRTGGGSVQPGQLPVPVGVTTPDTKHDDKNAGVVAKSPSSRTPPW